MQNAHWHECTYEWSKCDITENAKENWLWNTYLSMKAKLQKQQPVKKLAKKFTPVQFAASDKDRSAAKDN